MAMSARSIQLLDCTLRDGGHVVGGYFGKNIITSVAENLIDSEVDILEIGFIAEKPYGPDYTRFMTLDDVKRVLPENRRTTTISLMANSIDVEHFDDWDGTVDMIRCASKRSDMDWILRSTEILTDKGYKCSVNPVNCSVYSDYEYLKAIERVNKIKPYSFSIVDTFGVMRKQDLSRYYYLTENNLDKDIRIGLHLHENLGLAYSLAQHFLEIAYPSRGIILDASLLGMGRVPGNLCIEQIMDHLNCYYGKGYKLEHAYDAIDDYIAPIKERIPWGYSVAYALAAKYGLHRTYAEYLLDKRRLSTRDIGRILSMVAPKDGEVFEKDYIESLYRSYIGRSIDDSEALRKISALVKTERPIAVVAPGASISRFGEAVASFVRENSPFIVGVNFVNPFADNDATILTNIKRYKGIEQNPGAGRIVATSNLSESDCKYAYALDYNKLAYHDGVYCDDSTLMTLNLLKRLGCKRVYVAGFDGYVQGKENYFDLGFDSRGLKSNDRNLIKRILADTYSCLDIHSLTPSLYIDA